MKKSSVLLGALFLVLLAALPSSAGEAPVWDVDPAHSAISFSIRHIFTPVQGTFDKHLVRLSFDPQNLAGCSVVVQIPVASINTQIAKRDEHLRSPDFFDVGKHPFITFIGREFRRPKGKENSDKEFEIVGDFTIRGVTRRIVLPFTLLGIGEHPMKKESLVAGAEATLVLKRTDYGVGSGGFASTAVIGDEVTVKILIEANRAKN